MKDAVGDVAGGSAEEESKARGIEGAEIFSRNKKPRDDSDDGYGASDEKDAKNGRGRSGENAEGDAGVSAVHEIEEIMDDLVTPRFRSLRFDQGLGQTIEKNDG